ncbi:DNA ligase 1-like isoform X2 [Portunus trituberculatus]|nr:DNA ligase 1-like isoform X2 [Portunus trituberculatus]XP_045124962.1 DNA ligase 1-like isoform X2 [Portunus trituberculatus]
MRPHDLPPSELAALEADLATWAADLKREEDQRKTGKEEEEEEEEEEEDVKDIDEDDEEDEEHILSTNIPSDLPSLDNFSSKIRFSKVKKLRDALTTITGGHKSPGSLITDISGQEDQKGQQTNFKTVPGKKTPLIEVIENEDEENKVSDERSRDIRSFQENQEQGRVNHAPGKSITKVTNHSEGQIGPGNKVRNERSRDIRSGIVKENQEPATITYTSGSSVIKVTGHSKGHVGSDRAVEGLLREAERQEAEGDVLSASLTYNKVLSVSPHNAQARNALATLLCDSPAPATENSSAGSVLVQEMVD